MTNLLTTERQASLAPLTAVQPLPEVQAPVAPEPRLYDRAMAIGSGLSDGSRALVAKKGPQAKLKGLTQWFAADDDRRLLVGGISGVVGFFAGVGTIGLIHDGALTGAAITGLLTAGGAATFTFVLTASKRAKKKIEQQATVRVTSADIRPLMRRIEALSPDARAPHKPVLRDALNVLEPSLSAKAYTDLSQYVDAIPEQVSPVEARAVQVASMLRQMLATPTLASHILSGQRGFLLQTPSEERKAIAAFIERTLFKKEQPVAAFDNERAIYAFINELKGLSAGPNQ